MGEQRMSALMADSKGGGVEEVSGVHNNRPWQREQISTVGARVVSLSPSVAASSDRTIAAVKPHGSLCPRIPVSVHPLPPIWVPWQWFAIGAKWPRVSH